MLKTLPIAAVVLQDIYYTIYANSAGLMANGYYVKTVHMRHEMILQ